MNKTDAQRSLSNLVRLKTFFRKMEKGRIAKDLLYGELVAGTRPERETTPAL